MVTWEMEEKAREDMRKAGKADIKTYVAEGRLPDVQYRVALPSTANVDGISVEQILALSGHYLRITISGMPGDYADLDKQRELRETLSDLVNQHRGDEPFAIKVLTKGAYRMNSLLYDDLLEAAIDKAIEEVKEKNGGVLPRQGPILNNVPQPHGWIYD